MTKRIHLTLTATVLLTYVGLLIAPTAFAATQSNPQNAGQALEIAPPVITLTVNPGQTITTRIYLRDIASTNLNVTGQANDFVAAGEDGTPKVLLDPNENDPYSLRHWVATLPTLQLIPREIKSMAVTIRVPKDASPGGHYGVIRFTATPPSLKDTGVSLSASLGALLLVTVRGKLVDNLSLQSFTVNQNGKAGGFFEAAPLTFSELLRNTGNVHEQPAGQVTVTDMFGKTLAILGINQPPHNVLPASSRRFDEVLDSSVIGNKMLFGRYTATLNATYGNNKVVTGSISFWVVPYRLIAVIIAAGVAGFFGLRFAIRRYNRFIIGQAQQPGSRKRY